MVVCLRRSKRSSACSTDLQKILGDWMPVDDMHWSGNPRTDGGYPSNWNVETTIKRSPLWPYCGNSAGIFRCPGDDKYPCIVPSGPYAGQSFPRVRSMSM